MKRTIYDADHESFRDSVAAFLDREVRPHVEAHAADKALPREFWLGAGRQGFLGLEIPEEYGGSGAEDYRFNAVLLEEMNKVNAALGSCLGIHADITAPYLSSSAPRSRSSAGCPASPRARSCWRSA